MKQGGNLKEYLTLMASKATRSLSSAKKSFAEGDYDFASSRAYYAVFYLIEAMLLSQNLVFSKHSSVIGAFNKHFLMTGEFPKDFSKIINRLFRERQVADYEFNISIERDEAEKNLEIAEEVIKTLINHMITKDLINQTNLF